VVETADVVAWIREDAREFAEHLSGAEPDAPVPTCPGWTADDLVGHLAGGFANWYCFNISSTPDSWSFEGLLAGFAPLEGDHASKVAAFEAGIARFVRLCEELDLDQSSWAFGATEPARWWVRRAAVELTVHLMDAASLHETSSSTSATNHSEAIDELLSLLPMTAQTRGFMAQMVPDSAKPVPETPLVAAGLQADDTGRAWTMSRSDDGTARMSEGLGSELGAIGHGSSADVLAWLQGRPLSTPLIVDGDPRLLDSWNFSQY